MDLATAGLPEAIEVGVRKIMCALFFQRNNLPESPSYLQVMLLA